MTEPESPLAPRTALLIVNADDYGLTSAVSAGILRAHRDGVVTSTSVLAVAPGFGPSGGWLAGEPSLGVGVHLAAVGEDPPLLTAREIPTLVDRRGRFPISWRRFLPRALAGRVDAADLAREFGAQLAAVRALGVTVTHLDTHQHLHLWPMVRSVVLGLAGDEGVAGVRVPRSHRRQPLSAGLNRLSVRLAAAVAGAGLVTAADSSGVDEAGRLDRERLVSALDGFVARCSASAELGVHPGEADDPDRARYEWGYRWGGELELLASAEARRAVADRGFRLGTYANLVAPASPAGGHAGA